MTELMKERIPTITFAKARVVTELIFRYVQEQLTRESPSLAKKIRAYRGGYLPEERREIERQLFSGELLGVTSTNALELGIDIGGLEACLVVGYPGTIASTWQQAGRAGRAKEDSLVIFIPHQNPIDQYLVKNTPYFFEKNPEAAVIDPNNPHILMGHLRSAAFEAPVGAGDCHTFGEYAPALLELLSEAGELKQIGNRWHWRTSGFPAGEVSLRNISDNTFSIMVTSLTPPKVIGTLDELSAYQQLYTEAIYLHDGETYFVKEMNVPQKVSYVEKVDLDYYTQSVTEVQITVSATELEQGWRKAMTGFGEVEVMTKPYLFRKIKFGSRDSIGFGKINLEPQVMETNAFWVIPPPSTLTRVKEYGRDPVEAMLGIANVLTEVLPFLVMCDTGDIGSVVRHRATVDRQDHVAIVQAHPCGRRKRRHTHDLVAGAGNQDVVKTDRRRREPRWNGAYADRRDRRPGDARSRCQRNCLAGSDLCRLCGRGRRLVGRSLGGVGLTRYGLVVNRHR
jgi:DEAD/DEAH box helicase domain-containing protein